MSDYKHRIAKLMQSDPKVYKSLMSTTFWTGYFIATIVTTIFVIIYSKF